MNGTFVSKCIILVILYLSLPDRFLILPYLPEPWALTSMDCISWPPLSSGFYLYSVDVSEGKQNPRGQRSQAVYSDGFSVGSGCISQSMATSPLECPLSLLWAYWLVLTLIPPFVPLCLWEVKSSHSC